MPNYRTKQVNIEARQFNSDTMRPNDAFFTWLTCAKSYSTDFSKSGNVTHLTIIDGDMEFGVPDGYFIVKDGDSFRPAHPDSLNNKYDQL